MLDEAVISTHEVNESLAVYVAVVARIEHPLVAPRLEALRRFGRSIEVAAGNVWASYHQLSRGAGWQWVALFVDRQHLGSVERSPDRARPPLELCGQEDGHALALGEPVHRVDRDVGEVLAQL